MIMNKILKIAAAVSGLVLSAACQDELTLVPDFTVTDASGNVVLSLSAGNQYELDLSAFQYAVSANKNNEILAADIFNVASNMSWKIVAAEDGQEWVRPFPAEGDKEGRFLFLVERNNDQTESRTAYYNIFVNDGKSETQVPGMIIINQEANVDFLKVSVAKVDINKDDTARKNIVVTANVDWTYEIVPDEQYATADLDWLKDLTVHPAGQKIDTITVKASDNSDGVIRGAIVNIICESEPKFNKSIPLTQYGKDVDITGFPVSWSVGLGSAEGANFNGTFASEGYGSATTGEGRFVFVEAEGKADPANAFTRVTGGTGEPYVTGVWPGDYWGFIADTPVSSGTILKIVFETRCSKTGHKFWRLEYLDGEEWKVAGKSLTTEEPGYAVSYTHAMESDGSTNTVVSSSVKYENTTASVEFRFICAANWQASGAGALAAPNGGTSRISYKTGSVSQPTISCVAAGAEDMTPANISISGLEEGGILTFEGNPEASKTIVVNSDMDYTVTSNVPWITIENGTGVAEQQNNVVVTCSDSDLSVIRKGMIEVKSGISKKNILVIQSAAGGELEPLISVVGGNYVTVIGEGEEFAARVQANVDYEIEASEWISVVPAVDTRALVEVREHRFVAAPNMTGARRTGFVRFRQGELEAVLNVTQDNFEPRIDMTLPRGLAFISASGASVPVHIEANVDFTVSSDLLSLPTGVTPAGEYDMDFTVPANAGLSRDVAVTFYNEKYDFTCEYRIVQHGTDVIFADDFSWLAPIVKALGEGNYDTVGSKDLGAKAPNIYTTAAIKDAFVPLCNEIGYFIPGKADGANDVLYLQDCYLKMGKTSSKSQTSLTLPSMDAGGQAFTLSFDWARMVQGDGTIDKYTLTLMITGNGTFANGTKYSDELSTPQGKGEIFWTNVSAEISGADKDTRITIVATDLLDKSTGNIDYTKSGGKRMFIDNIVAKIN